MLAVGEYEHRTFDAAEVLLDDDAAGSIAKHSAQHLLQLTACLVERWQDEHTLSGAQAVGLQHIGRLKRLKELQSLLQVLTVEGGIASRGNLVELHEGFGKVLRTFEHGAIL